MGHSLSALLMLCVGCPEGHPDFKKCSSNLRLCLGD